MLFYLHFNLVVKMRVFFLLLFALLSFANSQNFYVIPRDGSHACPPGEECHQLSYYADHSSMLPPSSNLTFFNGEHILRKEVTLSGFDLLLLQGLNNKWSKGPHESTMQSSVIIRCTNDSIIAFDITFTQILALTSLTITGCKTAFSLIEVRVLLMKKVSIQNNSLYGLNWEFYHIKNTFKKVMIFESSFYQNCLHSSIKICCHISLASGEINDTSHYYITHSNFSFGMTGACLSIMPNMESIFPFRGLFRVNVYHCLFLNNTAPFSGGLLLETNNYLHTSIKIVRSVFLHNKVLDTKRPDIGHAGGMMIKVKMYNGSSIIIFNSLFHENYKGGCMIGVNTYKDEKKQNETLVAVINSIFTKNTGDFVSGLQITTNTNVCLVNTSVLYSKYETNSSKMSFEYFGALDVMCTNPSVTIVFSNLTISHNSAIGIHVSSCHAAVYGTSVVSNNTSNYGGGGLLLGLHSVIYSAPSGRMIFKNNRAIALGGAIFSVSKPYENAVLHSPFCTFTDLDAIFVNNTAGIAGNDIYNGQYYSCSLNPLLSHDANKNSFNGSFYLCTNETFKVFSHFNKPISLSVSSEPLGICLCTDAGITDCTIRSIHRKVYPGSVITLSLATIGMCGGIIYSGLVLDTRNVNVTLGNANQQTYNWECKKFRYLLRQVDRRIQNGYLYVTEATGLDKISVDIRFLKCPPGLHLVSSGSCDCNPVIGSVGNVKCNVSWADTPVRRSGNIWLTFETSYNCTIANENCPFDYCNSSTLYLNLNDPDTQCMHNRSGTLCGGCQPGLSLMLGSNRCHYCNNNYLSLVIVFILAGIVLVTFLLVFNMTVSVGSVNGLLFSANIVKLNEVIFFPNGAKVPVLSQFIAWLNLDLGIETCFFNGLDGYWKTWLQFAFPIYIWLLIGAIIIGSHYSGRLSRVFGNNTVPVLATLILMSYSKLLRTITNALMISKIRCDEEEWSVWSVDANIPYFSYKHLFLFGVSFLFLLVGLLYGGMVFSAQWLQKCTGRYCKPSCDPLVKLKPLVDSYTGPYKDKYRFWAGLLIFIRVLLTALFSYTTQTIPEINNYIIAAICVFLIKVSATGMYRNTALNNFEFLHYFNLFSISLLSALSHQLKWINARSFLSSVSVCISMLLFVSTVLAHIYIKIEAKYGKLSCLKWRCSSINNEENSKLLQEEFYSDEVREGIVHNRESLIYDFAN